MIIPYNFPYKGPFEYDKFILNTLQYVNEIQNIINNEFIKSDNKNNYNSLLDFKNDIDNIYIYLNGDSNNTGLLNNIFNQIIKYQEG